MKVCSVSLSKSEMQKEIIVYTLIKEQLLTYLEILAVNHRLVALEDDIKQLATEMRHLCLDGFWKLQ